MIQSHTKVGEGGRLVIPAVFRKAMNIHSGDEVVICLDGQEIRIFRQNAAIAKIQSLVRRQARENNQTDEFLDFRKQDSHE